MDDKEKKLEKSKTEWWIFLLAVPGIVCALWLFAIETNIGKVLEGWMEIEWFIFAILALGVVGWIGYRATNKKE